MKLTRSQRLYATVLALCLAGLALDRTVLRPDEASADDAGSEAGTLLATPASAAVDTDALLADLAKSENTLAARFHAIAGERDLDPSSTVDAFRVPDAWLPERAAATGPTAPVESAADRFAGAHRLSAVMAGADGGYAIVDDQRLRVGETLDGFRLVAVGARSATLEADDGTQVELTLP